MRIFKRGEAARHIVSQVIGYARFGIFRVVVAVLGTTFNKNFRFGAPRARAGRPAFLIIFFLKFCKTAFLVVFLFQLEKRVSDTVSFTTWQV